MSRHIHYKQCRQQGLSLVEILVAMAIGLLLMAGVIQIFMSNKATFRMQEGLGRMQENARFALDYMTRDIRQAGYLGCTRNLEIRVGLQDPPAAFTPGVGIQGWEFIGTGHGDNYDLNAIDLNTTNGNNEGWQGWTTADGDAALDSTPEVIIGSDILRVWHTAPTTGLVTDIPTATPTSLVLDNAVSIASGDFILLSDCVGADLLQVCAVNGNTLDLQNGAGCDVGNDPGQQLTTLATHAEVAPLVATTYFIGKQANDPQNPPALFIAELQDDGTMANKRELVQGVESMQILYGEETGGAELTYRTAAQVANWNQVTTVRIGLLMNTISQVDDQNRGGIYNVNGTNLNIVVPDRRPRKIFTTTIHLRNRSV